MGLKDDLTAASAEFIGTAYFLFFGLGGTDAIISLAGPAAGDAQILATAFSFGWSLMINVWIWANTSGGVLNPAITIALMITNDLTFVRGILYIFAQFTGAILGSLLAKIFQPVSVAALTTLAPGTTPVQGLALETITTSILTLSVLMLAIDRRGGFMAAFGIGTSLLISVFVAGPYTGASLNPARTVGPAIVAGKMPVDLWIYFIGPILGSLLATLFYHLFKSDPNASIKDIEN